MRSKSQLPSRVFTARWEQPASEVYITGTFDGWQKSHKLEKIGEAFTGNILIDAKDAAEIIYYKYVVDGHWMTNNHDPQTVDDAGNVNNVLKPDEMAELPEHWPNSDSKNEVDEKSEFGLKIRRPRSALNVEGRAAADAAALPIPAEKQRNNLGYHRTSVVCGKINLDLNINRFCWNG
jgi:hypothetical protein